MKKVALFGFVLSLSFGVLFAGGAVDPQDSRIEGDYLEVRTSDVWTGPCFANGEVNLTGKEGLMAWQVNRGSWNGVNLEGLRVVAVVRSDATLGDPFREAKETKSVIIVDNRASEEQSRALVQFAEEMGGELLSNVVWTRRAPVEMELARSEGFAFLDAGNMAKLRTRSLNHHDMHCGNESVYYPPLSEVVQAQPVYALAHSFSEEGLGATWSSPSKRSAFIGTFSR